MSRYVITGGLGTGKTSAISALKHRVETAAEPARELIAEHLAATGESTLDHRPELFVERLISKSLQNYRSASETAVTVFDRGLPDCVAYAAVYGIDIQPAIDAATANRYENPVFVAPPWKEIYTTDDMRKATFAQAEAFYSEVISAYNRLGYELTELPKASVEERVAFITAHLQY
ncbi:MAG TPA: AAA family ATPase [Acidimicrobiia bacterium]|nr:AAA family ATPase [Acidimicrobiia bacterium]